MYEPDLNDPLFINFEYLNLPFQISKSIVTIEHVDPCEIKNNKLKKPNYISIDKLPTKWKETYKVRLNIHTENILGMEELSNKLIYSINEKNRIVDFSPGDSIGIIPINSDKEIEEILNYFKITKKLFVNLKNTNIQYTGNVLELLKHIELYSIPTKKFCKEVYNLLNETLNSKTTQELKYLRFLISPIGINHYMRLTEVRIIDFLKFFLRDIENKGKFFNLFLANAMKNKPRFYSVCDYDNNTNEIELLIGIEQSYHGMGLISSMIFNSYQKYRSNKHEIENIFVYRQSKLLNFKSLRTNHGKILFICTGTAIASFLFQIKQMKPKDFVCLYGYRDDSDNILNYLNLSAEIKRSFVCISSKIKRIHKFLDSFNLNEINTVESAEFKKQLGAKKNLNRLYICGSVGVMKNIYGVIKDWEVSKSGNVFFDSWV